MLQSPKFLASSENTIKTLSYFERKFIYQGYYYTLTGNINQMKQSPEHQ